MYLRLIVGVLVFLTITQSLDYTEKRKTNVLNILINIQYSEDQTLFCGISKLSRYVQIYDGVLLNLQDSWSTQPKEPIALAFSSNNNYLAIADNSGTVAFYQKNAGEKKYNHAPIYTVTPSAGNSIDTVNFMNGDRQVVLGCSNGQVYFYDFPPPSNTSKAQTPFGTLIGQIDVSPIDRKILVGGGRTNADGKLMIINPGTFGVNRTITIPYMVESVKYTSDGKQLIFAGNSSLIKFHETTAYAEVGSVAATGLTLYEVSISRNGLYLAAAGNTNAYTFSRPTLTGEWSAEQKLSNSLDNIALSSSGSQLVVLAALASKEIDVYTLCANDKTFYNSVSNLCGDCLDSCRTCHDTNNQCYSCSDRFYLVGTQCLGCTRGCLTCVGASTNCTQCDDAGNFQKNGTVCSCKERFFPNGSTQCDRCIDGCVKCGNGLTCDTCDTVEHFIKNDQNKCECQIKYRQDGPICNLCGNGCLRCNALQCTTCDDQQHWVPAPGFLDCKCDTDGNFIQVDSSCVCKPTFYENTNGTCEKCKLTCSACSGINNCSACNTGLPPDDGFCYCPDKEYFDEDILACVACSIPNCKKCGNAVDCLVCDTGINRILNGTKCDCIKSYYEDTNKLCQPCNITGCDTCQLIDTGVNCTDCREEDDWIHIQTGGCVCRTFYYQEVNQCLRCEPGCFRCRSSGTFCTECTKTHQDPTPDDGKCKCGQGNFAVGDYCQKCVVGCSQCSNNMTCNTCNENKNFIKVGQVCKCQQNTFIIEDQCKLCTVLGCTKCKQYSICETCDSEKNFQIDNFGGCKCKPGYFLGEQNVCQLCLIKSCTICTNKNDCQECGNGYQINDQKTQCVCKEGKYQKDNNCQNCNDKCLKCQNGDGICQQCAEGFKIDGMNCIQDSSQFPTWAIVLISVGGAVVLGASIAAVYFCCIKKKKDPLNQEGGDYAQQA